MNPFSAASLIIAVAALAYAVYATLKTTADQRLIMEQVERLGAQADLLMEQGVQLATSLGIAVDALEDAGMVRVGRDDQGRPVGKIVAIGRSANSRWNVADADAEFGDGGVGSGHVDEHVRRPSDHSE